MGDAIVRTVVRVSDGTADLLDDVAAAAVVALRTGFVDRWGPHYVPRPEDAAELDRMARDYRGLADRVIAVHLDRSLRRRLEQAVSHDTTDTIAGDDEVSPS